MNFSVIIPTYKCSIEMITRAIDSVKQQAEQSFEIIIVDDNEKDSEWKNNNFLYSQEKQEKVEWLFQDTNHGANVARNVGVRRAKGDIIAFLDSDDEWDCRYLEKVKNTYENSDAVITACEVIRVFPERTSKSVKTHADGYIYNELIYGDIVGPTSAVTVKRDVLISAGMFDEELPARQDYDTWLRVCKVGNISYIREPLVKLYCDDHIRITTSGSDGISNHERGTLMVIDKLLNEPDLQNEKDKIQYAHTKYLGVWCLKNNRVKASRGYFKRCLKMKKSFIVVVYYVGSFFSFILRFLQKIARHFGQTKGYKE